MRSPRPRGLPRHRRARDRRVGRRPHRGRHPRPARRRPATIAEVAPDTRRAAAALLRGGRPLRPRRRVPGALGYTDVVNMEAPIAEWEARAAPGRADPAPADRGAAAPLLAPAPHPRDRPGGPAQAARRAGAAHRRRAASDRRSRCTSPRRGSGPSASSTTTWSTSRTSSARCSTASIGWACARPIRPS